MLKANDQKTKSNDQETKSGRSGTSGTGLTVREIEGAKAAPGERLVLNDGKVPGMHVRVTAKAKVFAVWLRVGKGRSAGTLLWTIARVGEVSLEEARQRARRLVDDARQGIDPREVAKEAARAKEQQEAAQVTVAALLEKFIDSRAREFKPDTVDEYRRILGKYIQGTELGRRTLPELKRFHVRDHVDVIAAENGEGMARSVRRLIKTTTAWAAEEERIDYDPLAGLKHTRGMIRDRVLTDEELVRFWNATGSLALEVRSCFRLQLLLGLRFPSELLPARWPEVDMRGHTWVVPGARRKGKITAGGGRTLELPLSSAAEEILAELRPLTEKTGRLFGRLARRSSLDYWWRLKVRPAVGGRPITPHDLRRTCATRIVSLGFPWTLAEAVLGHAVKGTAAVYVHAAPIPEMRRALEAWGRWLADVTGQPMRHAADVLPMGRR